MREIKFRAWSYCIFSEKWRMLEWVAIKNNCMAYFVSPEKFGQNNPNKEPHKIMQFTGLKDKNGVEIYEGDLVQHNAWDYSFKVIFNQEKSRFVCEMKTGLTQHIDAEKLEVIGNIHEHSHLLQ